MTYSGPLPEFYELFDHCNHTELYQLARRAGLPVLPSYTRESILQAFLDGLELPEVVHEIDEWRWAIMRMVIDHRRMLETQLTCPAKSFKEDACFGCVDMQVISCLVSNGERNLKLIQLRKKNA